MALRTNFLSAAAERMRRSRQRKRDGLRLLRIELRETEVDALIDANFLDERNRNDANAVICALYKFFEDILVQ
jgi:SOS response regulatory protein OraA/RecX